MKSVGSTTIWGPGHRARRLAPPTANHTPGSQLRAQPAARRHPESRGFGRRGAAPRRERDERPVGGHVHGAGMRRPAPQGARGVGRQLGGGARADLPPAGPAVLRARTTPTPKLRPTGSCKARTCRPKNRLGKIYLKNLCFRLLKSYKKNC